MAIILTLNNTLQDIVTEVEELDKENQKSLLAYIRALRISLSGKSPVSVNKEKKPLTMEQIDDIKHKVRRNEK